MLKNGNSSRVSPPLRLRFLAETIPALAGAEKNTNNVAVKAQVKNRYLCSNKQQRLWRKK
jgi:hypothetical protein